MFAHPVVAVVSDRRSLIGDQSYNLCRHRFGRRIRALMKLPLAPLGESVSHLRRFHQPLRAG